MIFSSDQKKLFNKNLNTLSNLTLKDKLKKIKDTKFELILGKDSLDINLKDTNDNTFLYKDTMNELTSMLKTYNNKYLLYPILYFYGFGNGILFKALLQNKNHQHIVVFEKNIEIFWIMFHILDFSSEFKNNKLILFDTNNITIKDYELLTHEKPFIDFLRIYFLELTSDYYEKMREDIQKINQNLADYFKKAFVSHGNDPIDALQGIKQFVYNIPEMLMHPSYTELIKKRKNLSNTAIIVSTGPSLIKQLPLLKQYANKATIFCADSAYPILAKYNIKPDYVCMLERTELTAEFFNNNFKDFDKDIIFICTSLVHPNAIAYLKKNNRNFMLISRLLSFSFFVDCKDFGYLEQSPSVAHMSYIIATRLNHKNIILIGQDLAYAVNGNSHPEEYQNSATFESNMYKKIQCKAYGNKGYVQTHSIWLLFKQVIEQLILKHPQIKTYNCTEGGVHIEGSIEKPFKEICKNLLHANSTKSFVKLENLKTNKQNELMLKAYAKICKNIKHCQDFKKEILKSMNNIKSDFIKINTLSIEQSKELLNIIINNIDDFKIKLEDLKTMRGFYEILSPVLTQFEFNLARIYVLNPITPDDSFNKSVLWIKEHLEIMQMIYEHIEAQENVLLEYKLPLKNTLIKRQLQKWERKLDTN
ncbi:motility associated factor glycosyltransferase family protein [Campylobacter jejuni]|uniref:motility associated factor glycosyltransferase family protein n=1 Tax=Campylobacter jejuni TaxID=197 RepID=UPI0012757209|nr:motility associated factor glycosyltransferase family protein [Campylobacter jejuni]EAK5229691.1 motility associated factor glycosyltransferase family protein [Campylobacter jejuni]ECR1615463.1 motility associated factor glycosyltransferase family protein [Campylobacter jejuni]EDP2874115.1 DUF115 domain-containing protein [Campylobacter jejuni]EGA4021988.1 motility associated factor glycosyltransferase family protein [Campylobacter jejuni]GML90455.1 motility associated factor glycosyltransf